MENIRIADICGLCAGCKNSIELAKQNDIAVLQCKYNMFDACGLLYSAGLRGDNT